jgi:hypothetical protein
MDKIVIKSVEDSGHPKDPPFDDAGEHCEFGKNAAQDCVQLAPGTPRIQRTELEAIAPESNDMIYLYKYNKTHITLTKYNAAKEKKS